MQFGFENVNGILLQKATLEHNHTWYSNIFTE